MAQRRQDQIVSADDIREYLATRDDFALELFVYGKAREFGFSAMHGGTYIDPVMKKPRQYDVRASCAHGACAIDMAIECKSLRHTYPLVLSRIPRAPEESYHQIILSRAKPMSLFGMQSLIPGQFSDAPPESRAVTIWEDASLYPPGELVGKSTTQIGRDQNNHLIAGDNEVYEKWSQALASANDLISFAANQQMIIKLSKFILPILVVSDETLWIVDYTADGQVIDGPKQTDESTLFVNRGYDGPNGPSYSVSHLQIITQRHVGTFFERLTTDAKIWQRVFGLAC